MCKGIKKTESGLQNMKTVRIGYTDVYPDMNPTNNVIYNALKKRYNVEIIDTSVPENRDKVEYLIYSASGKKFLDYKCVRIFITGENLAPNFNLCDYAIGFEHMSFGDRFFRLPIYFWEQYKKDYDNMLKDRLSLGGPAPEKREFCGIVASNNGFADPMRENFFNALSGYKTVDSGGRAYNNIGLPEGVPDKNEFLKKYKFSIAYENSSYPGYCTEKLMQAFAAGNVPIYWGDSTAVQEFNEKAFINCCGLTPEQAVEKVKEYDNDDERYLNMLREKTLLDDKLRERTLKEFEDFLYNIFDKTPEEARQIPTRGKMMVYYEDYKKLVKRDEMLRNNKVTLLIGKILAKRKL